MSILEIIILIGPFVWFLFSLALIKGWLAMPDFSIQNKPNSLRISVIIPVRNEEKNILLLLKDLENQSFDHEQFEVLVANDNSNDRTAELVSHFSKECTYALKLLTLTNEPHSSPKKRAISQALHQSKHEWIVTTDGDCRVGKHWLAAIASFQQQTQARLISGPVTFHDEGKASSRIQIVEFASLIGSAAVAMFWERPNMCNGANLSYSKATFQAVGGFSGNENLASGDDEFLMHKVAARFPGEVRFVKSTEALVTTEAHQNFRSFYQQRRRWASKWKHYQDWKVSALAIFVFLANVSCIAGVLLFSFNQLSGLVLASMALLKFSSEFIFLSLVLRFLGQEKSILLIPLVQLIYPFYVCFFGLAAQGKGYEWKGRKLQ
ncbi:glycosyltransferase [Siphonobacter sp. SORGH_AS_0500]|uniref:glycosyltransferase n=1 Tax=Siphonobacter sp. SORGH_AS_0500 TaxID=1864824 RepID=UPI0028638272|nr:glycosyltransferase [Siphonobacter sp. SORGH_AS_0500]MDR6194977.1 cellulose synthase/poly-beta-1,6-N-acetylglucosamine synthase-like glycosyltransferase [Siphonobacter sp. SORGH_AS_0500]